MCALMGLDPITLYLDDYKSIYDLVTPFSILLVGKFIGLTIIWDVIVAKSKKN